jgi:hypothetical protein
VSPEYTCSGRKPAGSVHFQAFLFSLRSFAFHIIISSCDDSSWFSAIVVEDTASFRQYRRPVQLVYVCITRTAARSDLAHPRPFPLSLSTVMLVAFPAPVLSVTADAVRELEGSEALSGLWTREFRSRPLLFPSLSLFSSSFLPLFFSPLFFPPSP